MCIFNKFFGLKYVMLFIYFDDYIIIILITLCVLFVFVYSDHHVMRMYLPLSINYFGAKSCGTETISHSESLLNDLGDYPFSS